MNLFQKKITIGQFIKKKYGVFVSMGTEEADMNVYAELSYADLSPNASLFS